MEFLANGYLSDDENVLLIKFHDLVLMLFKAESEDVKTEVTAKLDELIPKVKEMAGNFKKTGKGKNDVDADKEE